jgi:hypothetical protein
LRYDRISRLTGQRIGNPNYIWPDGYRDAEGHDMNWWRSMWAEDMYVKGLSVDAEDEVAEARGKRKKAS